VLGQLGEEDQTAAATVARAIKYLLDHDPDGSDHLQELVADVVPALHHPSFTLRRISCDITYRYLISCSDVQAAIDMASHLLPVLTVRASLSKCMAACLCLSRCACYNKKTETLHEHDCVGLSGRGW
jgi:hypothetical protein